MNKRGISAIVATVLIILITVAAVTIIWVAIIPMINNMIGFDDPNVRLRIVSAEGYTVWDEENRLVTVQVSRTGGDSKDLEGFNLIFVFDNETVKHFESSLEVNLKKVYHINLTEYSGDLLYIRIAPVFSRGEGEVRDVISIEKIDKVDFVALFAFGEIFGVGFVLLVGCLCVCGGVGVGLLGMVAVGVMAAAARSCTAGGIRTLPSTATATFCVGITCIIIIETRRATTGTPRRCGTGSLAPSRTPPR